MDGNHLSFGGFPFVQSLILSQGVDSLLDSVLPRAAKQAKYRASDVVFSAFYSTLMGGDCLEDVNFAHRELKNVRGFAPVSSDTLRSRLLSWSEDTQNLYSGDFNRIQNRVNNAVVLNDALQRVAALSLPPQRGGYRLDVDAHLMEHDKPDAAYSYQKRGGYAPLCSFVGSLPVQVEMRGGNTSPGYGIKDHVLKTIAELKEKGVDIREVCSDAAGYQLELLKRLDRKGIRFYIRAKKSPAMEKHMGSLTGWTDFGNKNTEQQWTESTWNGYRLIVQRQPKPDGQTSIFSAAAYIYRAIITNDSRIKSDGAFIIRHYNKRGGIERNFDVLRNDFGWAKMPFSNMADNTSYLLLMALCLNLFEWVKTQVHGKTNLIKSTAIRVKAFVFRFAAVPAKWIQSGRQTLLKIFSTREYSALLVPS